MLQQPLVRAPELPQSVRWLNSPPLSLRDQRGRRVVLIDFWDYTCINCLRTLPYVIEWDAKYRDHGLLTIGVHAPEFSFAREARQIERAVAELGISYPVVLDNEYDIWQAFSNKGWPSKFLIDAQGYIRYQHLGEGEYLATELAIQAALREANPAFRPQPLTIPKRPEDSPGVLCYRPTPELYCGYERSSLGNREGVELETVMFYADPGEHQAERFYLHGAWRSMPEYCALAGSQGHMALRYKAKEVNVVLSPSGDPVELMLGLQGGQLIGETAHERPRVIIYQDGQPLARTNAGADVVYVDDQPTLIPDRPRMMRVVNNPGFEEHELRLEVHGKGCAFFSFTFTTCPASSSATQR
ncbi:MAG: redoxin family protein [Anaerolineae bacterium]|nr:redoxin family protein [Thermoflexales bacterium]MDW8407775.1 redoxin family protein [Anaerolineae bacterium]